MNEQVTKVAENAAGLTYGAAGTTVVIWGLHISDIAAIISSAAAVCGVLLQFYVFWTRRKVK